MTITREQINAVDKSNMYDVLKSFHTQIEDAVRIVSNFEFPAFSLKNISNIIINGLGGSAIGGDFVRSVTLNEVKIPVAVNRNYNLPEYTGNETLSIISSYSGNTEETLSAMTESIERGCTVICITSGGEVAKIANDGGLPLIIIPHGYQPRCALGYSFFVLYGVLQKLGIIENKHEQIESTINLLRELSRIYSDHDSDSNPAVKIATSLKGMLPVVYSTGNLDVVNLRWRGQLSENAKVLAYGSLYPEMNHNELVGWKNNEQLMKKIAVIMLKDKEDHERNKVRMRITGDIYREYAGYVTELAASGKYKLERNFELTYLGDWVSYYLAILNNEDPTPVKVIEHLKKQLSEN